MSLTTQTTSPFQGYQGGSMSKVLGVDQGGDKKDVEVSLVAHGGDKELAQGESWTIVKSPTLLEKHFFQILSNAVAEQIGSMKTPIKTSHYLYLLSHFL